MEQVIQVTGLCVVGALLALVVKRGSPETALLLAVGAAVVVALALAGVVKELLEMCIRDSFYTVDMRFFYHVTLQAYLSCPVPVTVEGLCVFDKRAILFGSEGHAKIFSCLLYTSRHRRCWRM